MIALYIIGAIIAAAILGFVVSRFYIDEYDFPLPLQIGCVILWPLVFPFGLLFGIYILFAYLGRRK